MNREVYALLYSDNKDRSSSPSLVPTDVGTGYRQPKARLGRKHVRPWKWMTFTNDARAVGQRSACDSYADNISRYHVGWPGDVTLEESR